MRFVGCLSAERLRGAPLVVKLDPIADYSAGVMLGFEAMPMHAWLFQVRITRSTMPFCCGQYGVMNS